MTMTDIHLDFMKAIPTAPGVKHPLLCVHELLGHDKLSDLKDVALDLEQWKFIVRDYEIRGGTIVEFVTATEKGTPMTSWPHTP